MEAIEAIDMAADEGTKVGGELRGDKPCTPGRPPGNDGICEPGPASGGVLAPLDAGEEVVLKSLGGGEFVVGEEEDPR